MSIPLDKIHNAIAMRQTGHSIATIAETTGISAKQLCVTFAKYGAAKGTVTAALIQKAKTDLLDDAKFRAKVKTSITQLLNTEIALSRQLLDSCTITLNELDATPATARAKNLSSLAAAITSASNLQRRALSMDNANMDNEELPTLCISRLTDSEIEEIRIKSDLTDLELGGGVETTVEGSYK